MAYVAEDQLPSTSFLEHAFLKYVFGPATRPSIVSLTVPQHEVKIRENTYRIDYLLKGNQLYVAVELDGYAFHSDKTAFSYDRLRQNDLQAQGYSILRFSYDNIRTQTARCIEQLQAIMRRDPLLSQSIEPNPVLSIPDMDPNPLDATRPSPRYAQALGQEPTDYFARARHSLDIHVLRSCQLEALQALTNYFVGGGSRAACVMAVGAGKTVLGIAATLAFTRQRAMIVTPSNVIRGTFEKALNRQQFGNVLHHLPAGPLIPGCRVPKVLVLDRRGGSIRHIARESLLNTEIIVTNYHVLGDGTKPGDLLSKLQTDDIDFLVIDEAHIAAADSYQLLFAHFSAARVVLMSACFRRADGKPIETDVVYRYRLIDAIGDGVAKTPMVHRYAADPSQTEYEILHSDGTREQIVGKDEILAIIQNENKLATVTAKSLEPIRRVMAIVRQQLDIQTERLRPIKPRVLFAALGEKHAAQIADIAREFGIPCAYLHHSMGAGRIRHLRQRFERESGDLQGMVHLRMLGQGYDFAPITIVVPMRPYGSFAEFYQFIGRGIRVLIDPAVRNRVPPSQQILDIVFHSELGLEEHLDDLRAENDMDPGVLSVFPDTDKDGKGHTLAIDVEYAVASTPEAYVLTEQGSPESSVLHTPQQIKQRQRERERDALAAAYARYVESSPNPITFEEYLDIVRQMRYE